jgi:hypothetical protein
LSAPRAPDASGGRAGTWKKLGLVFQPSGDVPWRLSHAATPTAEVLADSLVRVYFTSRDAANRSHISSLEIDVRAPRKIRNLSREPLVVPGPPGSFDEHGAAMGCLIVDGRRRWLYYLGWSLSDKSVPWRNSIGLAVSEGDAADFTKVTDRPVLGRSEVDPHSLSYPWILREGVRWRMWYGSNLAWGAAAETMQHVIKYAESADGISWDRTGRIAVPLAGDGREFAVARPNVIRERDRYRMWYSRRTPDYRIGYAESPDGNAWTRRDELAGIEPSPGSWDGRTLEYACVFDAAGDRYMLYNGDDYGRAGFGLAVRVR